MAPPSTTAAEPPPDHPAELKTDLPHDAGFEPWPDESEVHVEWGPTGAALAAARGDLIVIVDVLSFSTAVTRAVGRGAVALSYSGPEIEALGGRAAIQTRFDAEIVAKDRWATDERFSLSPASLDAIGPGDRLIFTSANGAACSAAAMQAPLVLIGALTNRHRVAEVVDDSLAHGRAGRCTLVACGERWLPTTPGWQATERQPDELRPGLEDQLGVGAIAAGLIAAGRRSSPEARLAAAMFDAAAPDLADTLLDCVSGRELTTRGFTADVELAAALDSIDAVAAWDTTHPVREYHDVARAERP